MKIACVPGVHLSNDRARTILAEASRILSGKDSHSDASAQVRLVLDGQVDQLGTDVPLDIETPEDHKALAGLGYNVIVVRSITECSGYVPKAVGCAAKGSFMAVERYNGNWEESALEPGLWAHEFGHNAGLDHREDTGALLYPQLGRENRNLNDKEKRAYENKVHHPGSGGGHAHAAHAAHGGVDKDPGAAPKSVSQYLRRVYMEGIPYKHVSVFTAADVPALREALNTGRSNRQENAIVALAAIATKDSLRAVLEFVEKHQGDASSSRVRRTAVMALGYAIQTASGSGFHEVRTEALNALQARLSRNRTLANDIAPSALAGLVLSGDQDAAAILKKELSAPLDMLGAGGPAGSRLSHALSELAEVRREGIEGYTER